jgi:hypothetical protein
VAAGSPFGEVQGQAYGYEKVAKCVIGQPPLGGATFCQSGQSILACCFAQVLLSDLNTTTEAAEVQSHFRYRQIESVYLQVSSKDFLIASEMKQAEN